MAKNKQFEISYKEERKRRIEIRKKKRLEKFTQNRKDKKARDFVCTCGEDPYCYCDRDGPYSY